MSENKKSLFTEEELLERKQESQHEELVDLLRQVVEVSKDGEKLKEIAKATQNNAGQLSRFVEAFKNIKFDFPTPQVNVAPAQVSVDVKQEEMIRVIGRMFQEMKTFLAEVKGSTEKLSQDVQAMNESYRADKVMSVTWYSGMVDKITVKIKK